MQKPDKRNGSMLDRFEILYELDQESFERERKEIIEEEISKYPPHVQERLRRFQWTLDMKRKRCKNALEACFMFHEMLMKQVYGENGLLENLQRLLEASRNLKKADGSINDEYILRNKASQRDTSIPTKVFELEKFAKKRSKLSSHVTRSSHG